eukprot:7635306-Lingulodinium_polyedra.AAC.1
MLCALGRLGMHEAYAHSESSTITALHVGLVCSRFGNLGFVKARRSCGKGDLALLRAPSSCLLVSLLPVSTSHIRCCFVDHIARLCVQYHTMCRTVHACNQLVPPALPHALGHGQTCDTEVK